MGYYSTLSGELVVTLPLRWTEYRESEWANEGGDLCLKFDEDRETRETDDGSTVVRTARAVVPRHEEGKLYSLREELARLAEGFGGTHTFTGYLVRSGEETGDVERYWIEGTTAKSESARLSWPDGTEVRL